MHSCGEIRRSRRFIATASHRVPLQHSANTTATLWPAPPHRQFSSDRSMPQTDIHLLSDRKKRRRRIDRIAQARIGATSLGISRAHIQLLSWSHTTTCHRTVTQHSQISVHGIVKGKGNAGHDNAAAAYLRLDEEAIRRLRCGAVTARRRPPINVLMPKAAPRALCPADGLRAPPPAPGGGARPLEGDGEGTFAEGRLLSTQRE